MRKTKMKKSVKLKNKDKKRNNLNKKRTNKKIKCPKHFKKLKLKNKMICVGRCPHSGGIVTYKPKLDKLSCNLHGAQFEKTGKVILGSGPATSNVKVVKLK